MLGLYLFTCTCTCTTCKQRLVDGVPAILIYAVTRAYCHHLLFIGRNKNIDNSLYFTASVFHPTYEPIYDVIIVHHCYSLEGIKTMLISYTKLWVFSIQYMDTARYTSPKCLHSNESEVSGHFEPKMLVPKWLGSEVSWDQNVRYPCRTSRKTHATYLEHKHRITFCRINWN